MAPVLYGLTNCLYPRRDVNMLKNTHFRTLPLVQRFLGSTAVWIFCMVSYILFPGIPARFTESRKRERYLSDQVYISSKISHKAIEQTILRLLNDCRKSISRAITLTKHKTGPGGVLPRILERVCRKGSWTLALFKDWESETDTLSKAQSRKMTPCTIILLINNVAWREVTCVYPLNGY